MAKIRCKWRGTVDVEFLIEDGDKFKASDKAHEELNYLPDAIKEEISCYLMDGSDVSVRTLLKHWEETE